MTSQVNIENDVNTKDFATVLTTVQMPTESLRKLARKLEDWNAPLFIIGDKKSPKDFYVNHSRYINFIEQCNMKYKLQNVLPINHYSRKLIGYLVAIESGYRTIFDIDDDNHPLNNWQPRSVSTRACLIDSPGWINIYSQFTELKIWPRGYPLTKVRSTPEAIMISPIREIRSSIQQCLVDNNPDVDAVWRLVSPDQIPIQFNQRASIQLGPFSWCPFNSQATWWFLDAFPLLYLPTFCNPRISDIWRSFIAQRCLWEIGETVVFHSPDIEQNRNDHDLIKDFQDEIMMYLKNEEFINTLSLLKLRSGKEYIKINLRMCYEALITKGYVPPSELEVLDSWISDLNKVMNT